MPDPVLIAEPNSSYLPSQAKGEGASPSTLAHLLYLYILSRAQPHDTVYITIREMSRTTRIPSWRITYLIKVLQKTKPWLKWRMAGPKGWAIFYRPEEGYRSKRQSPSTPPSKRKDLRPSSDPEGSQNTLPPQDPSPLNKGHPSPPKAKIKGKIMTTSEWEKRSWMKKWRKKAYKDPSLKWAIARGVDVIRLVGHFVWHSGLALERVAKAVRTWFYRWTSGYEPLPEGGKPLFQCLFVRLLCEVNRQKLTQSVI